MLLSIPPRPSSRPRLIAGLSLRSGDLLAGRYRALSVLREEPAFALVAVMESGTHARLEALVLLAKDDAAEPIMLRFLADARKAASLQGPNLERIHHVGVTEDGHPFVVHEPAAGETLASLLAKQSSLSTESAVDIAIALSKALQGAHAVGLFHGEIDAKLVHVRVSSEGVSGVKLGGLGTSHALAMLSRGSDLAPLDACADVFSVGVLLYTMLAGAPPDADEPALLAGVPDGLAEIVDACLSRDPAQRPQSMASLAARLALYGGRPVFEKRPSLLVTDTGRYEALVLEQLVKDAGPSAPSIDVELDSDELTEDDMPTAVQKSPAVTSPDRTPEPVVMTKSAPPVAITVPPPAAAAKPIKSASPASPRKSRRAAFAAGACAGIAAIALAFVTRHPAPAPAAPAAAAAPVAEAPLAPKTDPLPLPLPAQAQPAAPTEPRALAISDLPTAPPTAHPQPATSAKPRAKGAAAAPAAAAPAAAPAPAPAPDPASAAADPLVRSASTPIPAPQPQPKASDDDLRRFLDDRR